MQVVTPMMIRLTERISYLVRDSFKITVAKKVLKMRQKAAAELTVIMSAIPRATP